MAFKGLFRVLVACVSVVSLISLAAIFFAHYPEQMLGVVRAIEFVQPYPRPALPPGFVSTTPSTNQASYIIEQFATIETAWFTIAKTLDTQVKIVHNPLFSRSRDGRPFAAEGIDVVRGELSLAVAVFQAFDPRHPDFKLRQEWHASLERHRGDCMRAVQQAEERLSAQAARDWLCSWPFSPCGANPRQSIESICTLHTAVMDSAGNVVDVFLQRFNRMNEVANRCMNASYVGEKAFLEPAYSCKSCSKNYSLLDLANVRGSGAALPDADLSFLIEEFSVQGRRRYEAFSTARAAVVRMLARAELQRWYGGLQSRYQECPSYISNKQGWDTYIDNMRQQYWEETREVWNEWVKEPRVVPLAVIDVMATYFGPQ